MNKPALLVLLVISNSISSSIRAASPMNGLENLTLERAVELAERQHPRLAEARALAEAAAGRAQQAGAWPNPELIVGAQQLPLDSAASNQREYIAGMAQPIPVGGRLGRAREAELLERDVRERELEVVRRNLRKRIHAAFATALYQEEAFQSQGHIAGSFEKAVAITKARVEAGDTVPRDLARAEMEFAGAKVELQRAQALRDQSRVLLAEAMGDAQLVVKSLSGSLDVTFEIPTLESLAASLPGQPEWVQAEARVRASNARIALAKAERIPDVKVEALYHRLEAQKENTFDVGLSIPLPLFDRNKGRVREARAEAAAAEARARLTQSELTTRLHTSHAELTIALAKSRVLKTEMLPRADTVLKSAEARYVVGDISLNEVLPARRDWAMVQQEYLESLRDAMQAWADLSGYLKTIPDAS
jgi:cobalt-zinc-cadmium efflux system outer membrane protein